MVESIPTCVLSPGMKHRCDIGQIVHLVVRHPNPFLPLHANFRNKNENNAALIDIMSYFTKCFQYAYILFLLHSANRNEDPIRRRSVTGR